MAKPFIVGITGASGSGKTTFIHQLLHQMPKDTLTLISQDHYYKPIDKQPRDINGIENYDTPMSIDLDAFVEDIEMLKNGNVIVKKEYNFNNSALATKQLIFSPLPILLLEGVFIYHDPRIYDQLDLKLFIDTQSEICRKRRIERDSTERGNPLEEIVYRLQHQVDPAYKLYIEPHKPNADLIIPNNKNFNAAIEIVSVFLQTRLKTDF